MKKTFVLVLFLALLLVSCASVAQSSETTKFSAPESGNNLRIMTINSDQRYVDNKQKVVLPSVVNTLNGDYNVTSITTTYTASYLVAAEITYNTTNGEGNNLRVMFITSDKRYYNDKEKEVKAALEKTVNSGKYNIVDTKSVHASGYLVAAEVYYKVK